MAAAVVAWQRRRGAAAVAAVVAAAWRGGRGSGRGGGVAVDTPGTQRMLHDKKISCVATEKSTKKGASGTSVPDAPMGEALC